MNESMIVEMLITQRDGDQLVAGSVTLADGRVTVQAAPGYELLMENTLAGSHLVDGGRKRVTAKSDPVQWMRAFPENYNGSYLRARRAE
jgi:hypothetical protein